jgi:ABC-type sugar transport system ATPase subunit
VSASYLRLRNVVKSYDGKTNAVDDISIDISRGEFITLLGPSGSGKTTTLMMVAGFEDPTSGTIELADKDLTRQKPYHRNIGVVFQNYALFPHMTVARNFAFPLRMHGGRATSRASRRPRPGRPGPLVERHPRASAASSAWRSPARSRSARASCCSTSRSPRSTRTFASTCRSRSSASSGSPAPPPSW